jgi:hypothetical protein
MSFNKSRDYTPYVRYVDKGARMVMRRDSRGRVMRSVVLPGERGKQSRVWSSVVLEDEFAPSVREIWRKLEIDSGVTLGCYSDPVERIRVGGNV